MPLWEGFCEITLPHNDANHKLAFQDGAACLCVCVCVCARIGVYKSDKESLSNLILIFITGFAQIHIEWF